MSYMGKAVICLLLTAASMFGAGYQTGLEQRAERVSEAEGIARTARDDATAAQRALQEVQHRLDIQKDRLIAAQSAAKESLRQRDALQQRITNDARTHEEQLRKAAHASPDCADLAHLPVCPVVSERLFKRTAAAPADGR